MGASSKRLSLRGNDLTADSNRLDQNSNQQKFPTIGTMLIHFKIHTVIHLLISNQQNFRLPVFKVHMENMHSIIYDKNWSFPFYFSLRVNEAIPSW